MSFSIKNGGSFHSYVNVYQRVYPIHNPLNHYKVPLNPIKSHSYPYILNKDSPCGVVFRRQGGHREHHLIDICHQCIDCLPVPDLGNTELDVETPINNGIWGWVKTLVPSEPQNSWDLWMFIPPNIARLVLIHPHIMGCLPWTADFATIHSMLLNFVFFLCLTFLDTRNTQWLINMYYIIMFLIKWPFMGNSPFSATSNMSTKDGGSSTTQCQISN